ncbi:hypothetical protein KA017_02800, partial [Candidatus Woesebacteria bacterium]|nr:hypothetical protein [Candidatus Woesebacteria bacterium]
MFEQDFFALALQFVSMGVMLMFLLAILIVFTFMLFQWYKHRNRENNALDFVTLLIRVPKDNETKIDSAEQMFAGLYSLKKSGFFAFTKAEDLFSLEIVAMEEDIAFYLNCPRRIRDLVEKQINGAYSNAEIKEVDEVNIFNKKGKVAFTSLKLDKASFYPIKMYKDLPIDGLNSLTSALSKMGTGEGAIIQILMQPESKKWQNQGHSFVAAQKKREADPNKATYGHDPKEMEVIGQKAEKP